MDKNLLGYNEYFQKELEKLKDDGYSPYRVAVPYKTNYSLFGDEGELSGELSGKFFFENDENKEEFPVVGDWVACRVFPEDKKAMIDFVLPRKTKFVRKRAGVTTEPQVIAANVDTIFIMTSVNEELNQRRIERYLTLIKENDIHPVIIFNKIDLIDDKQKIENELKEIMDNEHHFISIVNSEGIDGLKKYFENNKTIALIGSSGVGKTSLINKLIPELNLKVADISGYKDKGKHTTTHRELFLLPEGGMIIDNPGLRELQLWEGEEGLSESFPDIEKYVLECKFTDCQHETEPGCAVKNALKKGVISQDRYKSYIKLQKEIKYFQSKVDIKTMLENKKKWKKITASAKDIIKHKYLKK